MFRKRIIGFSLVILILIISMGVACANENATDMLNKTAQVDQGKTFTDIQKQIDDADDNGTIELEGTYTGQGKAIKITKSITITSKNGATLNANKKSNILNIDNATVCIKNINFINSKTKNTPAIHSDGNLTIISSSFANNTVYNPNGGSDFEIEYAYRSAGAIFSTNCLKLIDCDFENNYATQKVYNYEYFDKYITDYGGAINSKGNLTINASRFKGDYIESHGNLIIHDSEFNDCSIYSYGMLNVYDSRFKSGIRCYNKSSIANSTFTKKGKIIVSSDINITGCNFTNNHGISNYNYEHRLEIRNCNFKSSPVSCSYWEIYVLNSSFEEGSNAIFNDGGNTFVINSIFSRHTGTAIDSANVTAINSTFSDNHAGTAGAIHAETLSLANCTFINNTEGSVYIKNNATINSENQAGPIYLNDSMSLMKLIEATSKSLTTTYYSGEMMKIPFTYAISKKPAKKVEIIVRVFKNNDLMESNIIKTDSKGIGIFEASELSVGNYNIVFEVDDVAICNATVKIKKAKTVIKAPKVTAKHKQSKYFKIKVINKATKKAVEYTFVKVKIGSKTYKLETNSKGIAKFNTKKLKVGKYKAVITSGDSNYKMSAKSTITIKR